MLHQWQRSSHCVSVRVVPGIRSSGQAPSPMIASHLDSRPADVGGFTEGVGNGVSCSYAMPYFRHEGCSYIEDNRV